MQMKIDEFKLRLLKFGNNLINSYFPNNTLTDKAANAMLKYALKNKVNDLDSVLSFFADNNKNIDINDFIDFMKENMIGSGVKINLQDYIAEDSPLHAIVPNRTLVLNKEDLDCFLQGY